MFPQTPTPGEKSSRVVVVHYHRDDVGDVRNAIDPSALAVDAGVDDALGVDNHDDDAGVGARSESGDGGVARRFGFFLTTPSGRTEKMNSNSCSMRGRAIAGTRR